MKDNLQNISDLIGALAEDIEEIKKILGHKGRFGQGRGGEKACGEAGACHTFLRRQHAGEHQRHFQGARKPSRTIKNHWVRK